MTTILGFVLFCSGAVVVDVAGAAYAALIALDASVSILANTVRLNGTVLSMVELLSLEAKKV
jgi:hypothetical protein